MNSKNKLVYIIIIVLLILIIILKINNKGIREITINEIDNVVDKNGSLVYIGNKDDNIKDRLYEYKKKYKLKLYRITNTIEEYNNTNNVNIQGDYAYIIYSGGSYKGFIDSTIEEQYIDQYFDKYIKGTIPDLEKYYKTVPADQFVKTVNSSDTIISVIGTDTCTYCSLLEHVINDVSKNTKYDIYYMNKDRMTASEYTTITDLNFTIPAKCSIDKVETPMKSDFAKPLTMVTKNGKLVDCILGYYDYDMYLSKLKEIMEG